MKNPRRGRRQIEERGNRISRPPHAPTLKIEGEREEEGDRRGLKKLAEADGARDGHHHEQVHVGAKPPRRGPGLGRDKPDAKKNRDGEDPCFRHGHRRLAMPRKESERATHSGLDDMVEESRRPEAAAQHGEQLLARQMGGLVFRRVFGVPRFGAHAGACDQLRDFVVRQLPGTVEDRHPSVDDVEGNMHGTANLRPHDPVEDRHFLGAVQTGDLEMSSAGRRGGRQSDVCAGFAAAATRRFAVAHVFRFVGVVLFGTVAFGRHTDLGIR